MQIIGTAWALVPSIVVLILAVKTKRLLEPMFIGSVLAFVMLDGIGFAGSWIAMLYEQLENDTVIWVALTSFLIGALIQLIQYSGGARALSRLVLKKCKTEKSSLLMTVFVGIIIFVDDYLKSITVSSAMKGITDKYNVPREMLGYTVVSVAAPGAILVPFSSWGAYMVGLFGLYGYQFAGSALMTYVYCIPYLLYAFVAIIVCILVIYGIIPKSKGMKEAYTRAATGKVLPEGRTMEEFEDDGSKPKLINMMLPLFVMIFITILIQGNILNGLIAGVAVALLLYKLNGTMSLKDAVDAAVEGGRNMFDVMVIIIFCYVFIGANSKLQLTEFIIASVQQYMIPSLFPAITFAVIAFLAFITGSFWELAAFAFPIMVPLGLNVGANIYMVLAAVICGTCFGSTACFYSDTDILVAKGCDIELMDMAPKMLPFFIINYVITTVLYAVVGLIF